MDELKAKKLIENCPSSLVFEKTEFEGYFVSNFGHVFSTLKQAQRRWVRNGSDPKLLTPTIGRNGYPCVYMRKAGEKRKLVLVHRLVLFAFVGSPLQGQVARHLNGVRTDCRLENLRWGTQVENAADKLIHGTDQLGEKNHMAVLSETQVKEIRNAVGTHVLIAKRYGVSRSLVGVIKSRKRWSHI